MVCDQNFSQLYQVDSVEAKLDVQPSLIDCHRGGNWNSDAVPALHEMQFAIPTRCTGKVLNRPVAMQNFQILTALFGGLTPLLSTWLIEVSGNKAAPGIWLAGAGAISLVATYLVYRGIVRERDPDRK